MVCSGFSGRFGPDAGERSAAPARAGAVTAAFEGVLRQALECFGCDAAGLVGQPRGGPVQVLASSEDGVRRADQLQLGWRQGAAVDALTEQDTRFSGDLGADRRWPRWGPAAAGLGWRSVLASPLTIPRNIEAALTLYRRRANGFDATHRLAARIFALYAATALAGEVEAADLQAAVEARHRVGLAQGVLMAKYQIGPDAAFAVLRRHSQHTNVKLRVVAEHVIATGSLPPPPPPAQPVPKTREADPRRRVAVNNLTK